MVLGCSNIYIGDISEGDVTLGGVSGGFGISEA